MKGRRRSIYLNLFLELRTVLFFCQWTVILSLVYSRQRTWQFFLFDLLPEGWSIWILQKRGNTFSDFSECYEIKQDERFRGFMSTSLWTLSWYSKHRLCAITSQISDQCEKKAENPLSLLFVFVFFLSCWLFNLPWLGTSTMIPQNMIYPWQQLPAKRALCRAAAQEWISVSTHRELFSISANYRLVRLRTIRRTVHWLSSPWNERGFEYSLSQP